MRMKEKLALIFRRKALTPPEQKKRPSWTFPWWFLFIAYAFSLICAAISIFFIIARGIEFGDLTTQKWLTSLLTGFFSLIFLIQPLKVYTCRLFHLQIIILFSLLDLGFSSHLCLFLSKYR